jgi:hypothetical protein
MVAIVQFRGGRAAVRMIVFASRDNDAGLFGATAKLQVQPICHFRCQGRYAGPGTSLAVLGIGFLGALILD